MTQHSYNSFFAQPKFIVGRRAMEHIPIELDGFSASRPIVITDRLQGAKFSKHFIKSLAESNVTIGVMFDEALPYENHDVIDKLAGLYKWRECDSVVAIGGGSIMDIAKAVAVAVSNEGAFAKEFIDAPKVPIFYVATSQIDGFEVTGSINIDGKRFTSDFLFPDVVCIDNRMLNPGGNLNPIVNAALLSLTHCIEGATNTNGNPFADSSAYSAIRLIVDNLPRLLKNHNEKKAVLAVINGIAIASTVQYNTKPGMVGLASNFLSKQTGNQEGMIAGYLLPFFIKYKLNNGIPVRDDLLLALKGIDYFCSITKEKKAFEAHKALNEFSKLASSYFPLAINFSRIQQHQLEKAASFAVVESGELISQNDCLKILLMAYENSLGGLQ